MELRIAICEDLPADADRLCTLIRQYCWDNHLNVEIDCFSSGEDMLEQYLPGQYQILFLDVLMDGMNGMDAAGKVRELDRDIAIILTTISREFAVDSYLVNAAFYIVKPVDIINLGLAMERCRNLIQQYEKAIIVTRSKQVVNIRLRDILYLESQRNDCLLYTYNDEIRTRTLLSSLEPELGGLPFLRCHRSFIVNLHWVEDMLERDFVLKNGSKIPISRVYLTSVQQEFNRYLITDARREIKREIFSTR